MSVILTLLGGVGVLATGGAVAYFISHRLLNKSRALALALFAHGILSTSIVVILAYGLHFHSLFPGGLHIHDIGGLLARRIWDCGLYIGCEILTMLMIPAILVLSTFTLYQTTANLMLRKLKKKLDPAATERVRALLGLRWSSELLVVKDPAPNAFSFALLVGGRRWRPRAHDVLVLTTGLVDILSVDELRAVVSHEAAHIEARDNRYLPFFKTLATVIFFDPLVRLVTRRVSIRREFDADERAARVTGRPLDLARALTRMYSASARGPHPSVGIMERHDRSLLLERIRRLIRLADEMA